MGHLGHITEGEMLKFLSICAVLVALGVVSVVSIPMDMEAVTTIRPEATTEDTTGRLLSLPVPEKCANRPKHFEHGGHNYRSPEMRKTLLIIRLTGLMAETSAENTAWILSALKHLLNMSSAVPGAEVVGKVGRRTSYEVV